MTEFLVAVSAFFARQPLPAAALLGLAVLAILWGLWRGAGRRRHEGDAEERLSELMRMQGDMQARLAVMTETLAARQTELGQSVNQRLDGMSHRLGATLTEQTKSTHENLRRLQERLAVIDAAQSNIQTLAKDVVGLQAILSNKQTRGAFGQGRMEAIIADGLPRGAYQFQTTLSNGFRPDCTVRMPNGAPPLVIDAKFPLEAWNLFREATAPEARKAAQQQFRRDLETHIRNIAEKYLLAGETQDTAFLFVPSESVFAEIHEHFEGVVEKAQRARIVIVSPSLLMLSIQVIQAVLKDQRMREQAHLIQGEVAVLMDDLGRLDERTRKLQGHFLAAQKDVEQIVTSSDKLARRGARIGALDLEAPETRPPVPGSPVPAEDRSGDAPPAAGQDGLFAGRDRAAATASVESRTGLLRLRVVDED